VKFAARLIALVVLPALPALLAIPAAASAQYKIDTWTTEQGLPQASVGQINQTRDGFLWFGTFGGLVRFDGINFRVFDTVSNPELPSSRLGAVLVDAEGLLWVATQSREVMLFDGAKFRVMGAGDGLTEKGFDNFFLYRGRALVRTVAGDFLWKKDRFVPDVHQAPPGFAGRLIVGSSAAGALWYLDAAGLAHRYEGDRHTRTVRLPPTRGPIFVEDSAGRLWMREVQTGFLICVTGDTVRTYTPKDGVIPIDTIWMMEDPDGTLWFAEIAGVLRYRNGRFTSYTKADGLPATYTNSIFRDREGTHWVATQGGLARFTEQPIASYAVANGLATNNTYPILQDRRGDIWIGGWPGLTRYRNGVFEDMTRAFGLGPANVLSLLEDRDGFLWLGLWGGGVWRINIAGDGRAHNFPGTVAPGVTFAIYQGRGPDIWFGSERGAVRYRDGVFESPVPAGSINTFFEDAAGALWMGTEAGLARYANGVVTQFGEKEGFSGRRVRVIHPDANGALWIGTYDTGLFRYRNGTFTRYTTSEGLPTNGAFQILEDNEMRFWICSNVGIYRVAKSELDDVAERRRRTITAVRYGRDDGMANQECNGLGRPAGIRATDGRFWFPTQGGVAVVDPAAVGSKGAPPVLILNAEVGGFPVSSLDRIEIRSGSTSFQAHYTALTFVRPELAQFKYKMEGLDPDWIDAGTDRTARYARLPFGDFRFRVIAANRDGVWNEEGASIAVTVVPPFWRTAWFTWLMAGMVLSAGLVTHRVRLGVIDKERARQEAFARQLIDSQETDRKRIASDLHDGVSQTLVVIRNWSQMSGQSLPEDSAARKRLGDISHAAGQALGEVREVVQDLVPYHLDRLGLVEAIRDAASRVADASGIPITCSLADVNGQLSTDSALRLFRVLQEGLNNVVKHSRATHASVEMTRDSTAVQLAILDNGKGFDPKAVNPASAGHGFGLVGMAERTRMMGGKILVDSVPGQGTSITISVPFDAADTHPHR
jgi:signal transduction histidine kinase/ligand-binding sensor domain-containing protein